MWKEKLPSGKPFVIFGSLSAGVATCLGQPFDVIKTVMISGNTSTSSTHPIQIAKNIYHTEGLKGLYRGTVPAALRVFPGAAVGFGLIHSIRRVFYSYNSKHKTNSQLSMGQNFLVGGLARGTTAILFNPIFIVKTKFEFGTAIEGSFGKTFMDSYRKRQLFKGAFSGVVRDSPYAGMMYMFYRQFQHLFSRLTGFEEVKVSFPASLISSICAVSITYPFDVFRTRVQLNAEKTTFHFFVDNVQSIYKQEGLRGYWRGFVPRASKRIFADTLMWTSLELLLLLFQKHKEQQKGKTTN